MLYAASVNVSLGKKQRRLDIIIEADNLHDAEIKAISQARKIYSPGKKANYHLITIVSETEAVQNFNTNNENLSTNSFEK